MAKGPTKTNAARALDKLGVNYRLQAYAVGHEHLSAQEVAAQIGMDAATVFKTLLAHGDKHAHCFAVIPATAELDLKALARASDNRKVTMVPLKEVQPLTGYVRGGVTALATRRPFPAYLDESALAHPAIAVSAGMKGLQLVLAPRDYVRAATATIAALTAK